MSEDGVASAAKEAGLDRAPIRPDDVGLAGEPGREDGGELSAGEILRARLGNEVVDRLVDPLLGGINAGGVDTMSLGVAAPQIARALVGHRDLIGPLAATLRQAGPAGVPPAFLGLRGGLSRLVRACAAELDSRGVEIRRLSPALSLHKSRAGRAWAVGTGTGSIACDGVVIAAPGEPAASLLREVAPGASGELGRVAYATVAILTLAFASGSLSHLAGGTGVLVPRVEDRLMTAATWLSVKWPWMAAEGLEYVRVSAGRFGDERLGELDDTALAGRLTSEVREIAGICAEPSAVQVTRWPDAFPQYMPGHARLVERACDALGGAGGLALAGAVLGGIGIPACITSGEAAATRVLSTLGR